MNNRAKLISTPGVSALAGVLIATLALEADTHNGVHAEHGDVVLFGSRSPDVAQPTFYSEISQVNGRMHQAMDIAASGDVDRDFMLMMIAHHQGAIDMALLQLKYGTNARLKRLAQSIIVEQGQEIAYMRTLLAAPPGATAINPPAADR